jgi:uncharacterized protein with GYD domain
MAKFLIEASYTAEGVRGLVKDKASGRQAAVKQALAAVGGKLDAFYYAFGDVDAFVVCDCPDNISAAALALSVAASGMVRIKTIPLMTVAEADQALAKMAKYRAPGA